MNTRRSDRCTLRSAIPIANLSSASSKCCGGGTGFDACYRLSFSFKRKLLRKSGLALSAQSRLERKKVPKLSFRKGL